jgi:hypothetical protein
VCDAFDCDGAFVKLHEINAFAKFQIALVVKLHPESLVLQNELPMLNIIGWLQNILSRTPLDVNGTLIFK